MKETEILNYSEVVDAEIYSDNEETASVKDIVAPLFISIVFIGSIITFFITAGTIIVTQILARDIGADLIVVKKSMFILISSGFLFGSIMFLEKTLLDSDGIYRTQMKVSGYFAIGGIIIIALIQYIYDYIGVDIIRTNQLLITGIFISFMALLIFTGKHILE